MTEEVASPGRTLNATFLPSTLLRKNENKLATSLTSKYQFQKTTGNSFITIDPPEIKFQGYQLNKGYTATVRIINRAPIPQRITLIPPQSQFFSIKTNKKGSIASGMAENITVLFRSNEYKYRTDVISIRTETDNFVIPLFAYPTLPNLRSIFPKLIDFGAVECKEATTYQYPITNSVPLNFEFQFQYQKQSQEISIYPLKGVIPAEETIIVEITFVPTAKCTSYAEVLLHIHQFDFQPLPIRIIGSGLQPMAKSQPRKIKSSKLAPLKEGEEVKEGNKVSRSRIKRRPSGEGNMLQTSNHFSGTGVMNPSQLGTNTLKRPHIRTSYPKLMSMKKTVLEEQGNKTLNPEKIAERQYLNRFTRIQDLDKEKDIKFAQYLGDRAMTETQVEFEVQLTAEIQKVRLQALERKCRDRVNPELSTEVGVEFKNVSQKTVSWDDKQNDEHHNRRVALTRFMNAGTKVILNYRLMKRLGKIRQLLSTCRDKKEVRKLVEDSHAKAMDREQGIFVPEDSQLNFDFESIQPTYFELQFEDKQAKSSNIVFKPEGKASFDDLGEIKEIVAHNMDKFKFSEMTFPPDYYNHNSYIPPSRQSAEEEYFYKTAALNEIIPEEPTAVYRLPLKVPAHHFIYDNQKTKRYHNYITTDEKDPEVFLENGQKIEDQFEGWTGGQYQILKYKFTRNLGCSYTTFSGFNNSSERNPLPPLATLGQGLPETISEPCYEDTIDQGDSDEQNLHQTPVESALKFLDQIQGNNADLKERRKKGDIRNPEKAVQQQIQKSLQNLKLQVVGDYVGRVKEANKWVQHNQTRFLL